MKFKRSLENTLQTFTPINWKNQEEINKFLDTYDPPKLNQDNINNLNRSLMSNEIETLIKNLPKENMSFPEGYQCKVSGHKEKGHRVNMVAVFCIHV
jgi:hypothetical protein